MELRLGFLILFRKFSLYAKCVRVVIETGLLSGKNKKIFSGDLGTGIRFFFFFGCFFRENLKKILNVNVLNV